MQGFLGTPWNATSRTTAQDALWQHILDRNTSSQPFMTPCARQVMNRISRNVTPPWAGCWGPLHSCSTSEAIYLPAQRNRQPARPTPQTEAPPHPGKATRCPVLLLPTIWNHLHIEDSCGFQWRDVDAVTSEFPLDLHNTSPEYFRHLGKFLLYLQKVDPEINRVDRLSWSFDDGVESTGQWKVESNDRVDRTYLKSSQSTFSTYEVNEIGSVITHIKLSNNQSWSSLRIYPLPVRVR